MLEQANIAFTVIFTLECISKLIGLGFSRYISNGFNAFDFIVVMAALFESFGKGGKLSILRGFRIMRIFKLIKGAKGLQLLVR